MLPDITDFLDAHRVSWKKVGSIDEGSARRTQST
jgi:hypothetical protein